MKDDLNIRADAVNLVALALNDDPRARVLAASGDEEEARALRDATVAVLLSITLAEVDPRETLDVIRLDLHEQEFTQ